MKGPGSPSLEAAKKLAVSLAALLPTCPTFKRGMAQSDLHRADGGAAGGRPVGRWKQQLLRWTSAGVSSSCARCTRVP